MLTQHLAPGCAEAGRRNATLEHFKMRVVAESACLYAPMPFGGERGRS